MAENVIRKLLVSLGVNVSPQTKAEVRRFDQDLERIKGRMASIDAFVGRVAKGLAALAVAGATSAGLLVVSTGQTAQNIERQARALNLTRSEFQEYSHLFETFGSESKEISEAFLQLNQQASNAIHGQQSVTDAFRFLGITIAQLKGKRPAEVFELVADGAAKAKNRQDALAAASTLLGEDTAKKLLPALVLGADGLRRYRKEAHELGLVMDDDQLRVTKESAVQFRNLKNTVRGLANVLAVAFAPAVNAVLGGLSGWVRSNRVLIGQRIEVWARAATRAFEGLDRVVRLIGGWQVFLVDLATGAGFVLLLLKLEQVKELLATIRVALVAIEVLAAPVLGALDAALATAGLALAPLLLLLAGLALYLGLAALAVDDFVTFWQGGKSVLGDNLDAIERLIPAFGSVRHLIGALVGLGGSAWRSLMLLARAIGVGLTPVLFVLERALQPVIDALNELQAAWVALNASVSGPIDAAAAWVTGLGATGELGARSASGALGSRMAASVTGAIGTKGDYFSDASSRSVVQNNSFLGGGSATDHLRSMESAIRHASVSVKGGRR